MKDCSRQVSSCGRRFLQALRAMLYQVSVLRLALDQQENCLTDGPRQGGPCVDHRAQFRGVGDPAPGFSFGQGAVEALWSLDANLWASWILRNGTNRLWICLSRFE